MLHIRQQAKQGLYDILIKIGQIFDDKIPICLACAYGASKRYSHNSKTNQLGNTAKDLGNFVLLIQLVIILIQLYGLMKLVNIYIMIIKRLQIQKKY